MLAGLAGVLAGGQIGLNPNMGDDLLLPSFIAIIVGGVGSLTGTLVGGLLIGIASALTTGGLSSGSEAVIYVIMAGAPGPRRAGSDGRRRDDDMSTTTARRRARRAARGSRLGCTLAAHLGGAADRAALDAAMSAATPRSPAASWCFGLAAMALNLLLGFTGVMSFGHAAYFGLGAYGAGLALRYLVRSTPLGDAVRHPARRRGRHAVRAC